MEEVQTQSEPEQEERDESVPTNKQNDPLIVTPPSQPEPSYPSERLKRAAHMLFFKRGRIPGAKAWELKAGLGKSYQKVLDQLDEELKELDLQVKKVEAGGIGEYSPEDDEADKFRFFVRLRGTLTPKEARMSGWRIDNLAALAAALSLVVSKQGKVERKELEMMIAEKAGRWRTLTLTDTFLRTGYLEEDESGLISLGWRTKAEVDLPSLMMLVAEAKPEGAGNEESLASPMDESVPRPSEDERIE
jgi:hypothetical protein